MTIVDFKEQKEARRRAEWERLVAWQERELATARRVLEVLEPIVNQLLKQKRVRATPGARRPGAGARSRLSTRFRVALPTMPSLWSHCAPGISAPCAADGSA